MYTVCVQPIELDKSCFVCVCVNGALLALSEATQFAKKGLDSRLADPSYPGCGPLPVTVGNSPPLFVRKAWNLTVIHCTGIPMYPRARHAALTWFHEPALSWEGKVRPHWIRTNHH